MNKRSWVFGQGADCDVRIQDEYVSTRHCRVTLRSDGSATVEDLGSTNGTWIHPASTATLPLSSDVRIYGPTPIPTGWVIRIGRTDIPRSVWP